MENQLITGVGIGIISNVVSSIIYKYIDKVLLCKGRKDKTLDKIKEKKLNEVIDELLENGNMTYTELFGFKNVIEILAKADAIRNKESKIPNDESQTKRKILISIGF